MANLAARPELARREHFAGPTQRVREGFTPLREPANATPGKDLLSRSPDHLAGPSQRPTPRLRSLLGSLTEHSPNEEVA
jgi:hypothetical protein